MFPTDGRPGDTRGFLHKSFIGRAVGKAVTTFVPGVSTAVNVIKTGRSFLGRGRPTPPRTATARVTMASAAGKESGRSLKFGGNGASFVDPGFNVRKTTALGGLPFGGGGGTAGGCRRGESTRCCRLRTGDFNDQAQWQQECGVSGQQPGTDVGEAVMGRYGAALEPGNMVINRAVCLRGMQLADDGLCYNKSQITNKQRMWPAGRKPLLSGGDMHAISIAARAGRRMEGATKRLQRLGMMKKPTRRLGPGRAHAHAKPIAAVSV